MNTANKKKARLRGRASHYDAAEALRPLAVSARCYKVVTIVDVPPEPILDGFVKGSTALAGAKMLPIILRY
jgi:hypothetical protein